MLGRLFSRPKWQHRNAAVRQEGVSELPEGDPRLSELAQGDADAGVRRQAARRLMDADILFELTESDVDDSVRDCARLRLCRLASSEEGVSLAAERREALAWRLSDEQSMHYLLGHAAENVRRLVLERVERPSLLAEVALKDASTELRLAAVERIEQLPTLERIAREAKGQDKKVARRARDKAEALRAAAERPQRQRDLETAMRQLVEHATLDIVRFRRLADEWNELMAGAPSELAARIEASIAEFERLYAAQQSAAEHQARRRELCERAENLARECRDIKTGDADAVASVADVLRLLDGAWAELDVEDEAPSQTVAARFADAVGNIRRRLDELEAEQRMHSELGEVIATLKTLAEGATIPTTAELEALQQRWLGLSRGRRGPSFGELSATYMGLRQRALGRVDEARREIEKLAAELGPLLDELDLALDEGSLQKASALNDKVRHRRDRLRALQWTASTALDKRLRRLGGRLAELRDWRSYGAGQAREDLIARMQGLIGSDRTPTKLASEIHHLQDEWRALDRNSGLASEDQWQAFSAVAETAFAPCAAHIAEQQAERLAHTQQRAAFCDSLETLLASIDNKADWPAIDRRLRQARRQWRELGGVEPAEWKRLNLRFNGIVARLDDKLAPARERERVRREHLIAKVEALISEPDGRRAAEELKAAQAAWSPEIASSRKLEQALWQRFKAAADGVYAHIAEQRDEQRQAVEDGRVLRESLCEAAERLADKLAQAGTESQRQAKAELVAIVEQWKAAPRLPSRMAAALERRFEQARDRFAHAERAAARHAEAQERERWAERAVLCEELEFRLTVGMDANALADKRRQWDGLPPLGDEQLGRDFERRFERLCGLLSGETASHEELVSNETALGRLCLELEIMAGIDSPAQFAGERLALQVERMPKAMMNAAESPDQERQVRELLLKWYLSGPVAPEVRSQLRVRLEAAIDALGEDAAAVG